MPDEPDQGGPETIEPRRAAVRPRGRVSPDGEVLPIDEHVQRLFAGHKWGAVAICGRHGSGKSTALAHLAATLPDARSIQFIDDELLDLKQALARRQRVVFMAASRPKIASLGAVELVPWNQDDLIEYLLAKHKDRCASVMHRILADDSVNLGGIPELWAIVLDELAADVGLGTVRAALRRGIERLRPGNGWESGSSRACLLVLTGSPLPFEDTLPTDTGPPLRRLLRHRAVQVMVLSERIEEILCGGRWVREDLHGRLPPEVVREVAARVTGLPDAKRRLETMVRTDSEVSAFAASVLVATDRSWRPPGRITKSLEGAHLPEAQWNGVELPKANLIEANLRGADLRGARLDEAKARGAVFLQAHLAGASLKKLDAPDADFSAADLSGATLTQAVLSNANLERANLEGAVLAWADLADATLEGARVRHADLTHAILLNAKIKGADFTGANLANARLARVRLSEATFVETCFANAWIQECDLEAMELPKASFRGTDLRGSLLTGSRMPSADFENANLSNTGLAEVEWEGANLRNVNFRGASFHMGSSRSGLVGSTIASEGSRTGFYTDDYNDRDFKPAEEIRKANLRGADLRGANVEVTDFYLVDLRDAIYTPDQQRHFARCGAILR